MSDTTKRTLLWSLFALWLLTYAWSFVVFQTTEPTGSSFTRGLNRISNFLGWQVAAAVIGVPVWLFGRMYEKTSIAGWFIRLPLVLAGLLVVIPLGLFAVNWLSGISGIGG
jgi:magnesium-transporting ATPase (P-type)